MPIVRFIKNEKQNASAMKGSIDYCLQKCKTVDSQTGQRYVSGINCSGLNAYKEFMTTKLANHAKEFIDEMKKNGYEVLWTDERKYITYTCPNGMKCRDIKLHQEKYRKEKMELEFELRRIETEKCTEESCSQRYDSEDGTGIAGA